MPCITNRATPLSVLIIPDHLLLSSHGSQLAPPLWEERRNQEQARELRLWDKELKRVQEERKGAKGSAVDALRSQMAGLKIKDGRDTSRSEGSRRRRSDAMDDVD